MSSGDDNRLAGTNRDSRPNKCLRESTVSIGDRGSAITRLWGRDDPGLHRTATVDYDIVLEGTVGLELDNGAELRLGPGDLVVQNSTRRRWHNRGETIIGILLTMS